MAETVSVHVPMVEMRQEGGKWAGYITTPWFRYLLAANPAGFGTGTGVLHGNESGAPTWGPVDLEADVVGTLPVANGGLGGISATVGGLLYFATATTVGSTATGTAHTLLHGNSAGAPTWGAVDLASEVSGTLPVANGGTGATTSTGTGAVVHQTSPTINTATLSNPNLVGGTASGGVYTFTELDNPEIEGTIETFNPVSTWFWLLADTCVISVTNIATQLFTSASAGFFVAHDKTSGGMAAGLIDSSGVTMLGSGIVGITFSKAAGNQLQAIVTAGANPRSISVFGISIGTP